MGGYIDLKSGLKVDNDNLVLAFVIQKSHARLLWRRIKHAERRYLSATSNLKRNYIFHLTVSVYFIKNGITIFSFSVTTPIFAAKMLYLV